MKEKQNKIIKKRKEKKNRLRLWKKKTYLVVYETNLAKVC